MSSLSLEFTEVISCEPQKHLASDADVVDAARISLNNDLPERVLNYADERLIHFLMRNKHGSPFEHGYFKFRLEVPIFEFREHVRHRAGHSYNEMSGRYTELEPKFYVPLCARKQEGKPGNYVFVEDDKNSELSKFLGGRLRYTYGVCWSTYQNLLMAGIAKEQARMVLPVGIYTKVIWSCNPRSLMHFLGLRNHSTAQKEIQIVAQQAEKALKEAMPVTHAAFIESGRTAP